MWIDKFHSHQPKWVKWTALFLVGISLQFVLQFFPPEPVMAQNQAAKPSMCESIVAPLSPEEEDYAKTAWQYFQANYQPDTGFANSTGGYPSGTLWDLGNYLMAMNAARWLKLIPQSEFDQKMNKFLTTLNSLKLFEGTLPNKVYNAKTAEVVDYANKPTPRGIGWSALDIGRMLAAFHVIRTCHPQYDGWLKGTLAKWQLAKSVKDGDMYGAMVKPDGSTLLVQEGRLGYEEYAARGYELWGFKLPKALSLQPFKFVDIYGIKIPADTRDYQSTNANNYVVSESYILDGIEFGLQGEIGDYAARLLEVQKRRFEDTKQLTAVSEDNINKPPYFIYNTVYSNGVPWAAITEENKPIPEFRSISTKAAFGWRYLYPNHEYAKQVFDAVKGLKDPKNNGFYAGLFEATKEPNTSLTGNTNGLILEILYYKARGNRPLISGSAPATAIATSTPASTPTATKANPLIAAAPATLIPSVGNLQATTCPRPSKPLSVPEKRYAQAAWRYFEVNMEATGLPNDRNFMKGSTLWGLGDYLAAVQSARLLDVLTDNQFDTRIRKVLGMLPKIALFTGELPNRSYNSQSMQLVDYGNNPTPDGTGWSSLDVGRLLTALYGLKTCYPQYTNAIEKIILDWSYLRVVRDGSLYSSIVKRDANGRMLTRVEPETRLGYEEYAARGFQLWGFDVHKSAVGGQYQMGSLEGFPVPVQRVKSKETSLENGKTVTNPFFLYGLEFGLDPQMRALIVPLLKAQAERYRRTNILTTATTNAIESKPYILHSTAIGKGRSWETLSDDGKSLPDLRLISTAAAIASYALFPEDPYALELWRATLDLYDPYNGYYEGFYDKTGRTVITYTSSTNSMILEALLFKSVDRKSLIRPNTDMNSPWWQAVSAGTGQGLPRKVGQTAEFVAEISGSYWISSTPSVATAVEVSLIPPPPPPPPLPKPGDPLPPGSLPPLSEEQPLPPGYREPPAEIVPPPPPPPPVLPQSPKVVKVLRQVDRKPPQTKQKIPETNQSLKDLDKIAAKTAWKYFEQNLVKQTGFVNSGDKYHWTTWWDQGSAILGIHAARQLGLMPPDRFNQWAQTFLSTLEKMPLPSTRLPNKAYSTTTAQMRKLNDTPDPQGLSGWSGLDVSRFLLGLYVLRTKYPEYTDRVNKIVARWDLQKLVKNGQIYGGIPTSKGVVNYFQEGRLGYEQYAARSLQLWNLQAAEALEKPPIETITVDGVPLQVDRRNIKNSGASNYLTNDPYLLWGLELGWTEAVKPQVQNLLKVQAQRFERTGILTAVNEDSIQRPPYFLYYSVYVNGKNWEAITDGNKSYPNLKFSSTKAAFGWSFLMPEDTYARRLRAIFQTLKDPNRGYFSGLYENPKLGKNKAIDLNTNAAILEGLLYRSRGNKPIVF
ncbi:DUF3131 domain-containing protein [Chamaesiphon minutus]|uniref:DUF3131 domain-containing protein n=1 Tax=Chamaesiphon minutus (strain ATCC 27169 / PCC 6605) TaxID=1173020 RepID=K9UBY9_CHAP6|nr:DUF3131 domain-containing protein [Chamaesiphon minutus]AFY92153.1 Protein of unknown function (DUF3131) [Chamaesiphon minutus PCC 6605]